MLFLLAAPIVSLFVYLLTSPALFPAAYALLLLLAAFMLFAAWRHRSRTQLRLSQRAQTISDLADRAFAEYEAQFEKVLPSLNPEPAAHFSALVEHYSAWESASLLALLQRKNLRPSPVAQVIHKAAILTALDRFPEARQNLQKAAVNWPENPLVALTLADFLFFSGQFTDAADHYYRILNQQKLSSASKLAIFIAELSARRHAADLLLLRHRFSSFLQQKPSWEDHVLLLYYLTRPPFDRLEPELLQFLLSCAERAIHLAPDLLIFKLHKGALLYEMSERNEARKLLEQASADSDPDVCGLTFFYLARIERKKGHLDRALRFARSVLQYNSDRWVLEKLRLEFGVTA